jgi:hypothetical protein
MIDPAGTAASEAASRHSKMTELTLDMDVAAQEVKR